MSEERLRIPLDGGRSITAIRTAAEGKRVRGVFIYAPGAGSNAHDPFGRHVCRRLADASFTSVRIQFPYMEAKRSRPDAPALLEETWRAAIATVRARGTLIVGGRSMGGRIASQVVAQGERADGLALFAYPLHPPGRPDRRRDEHLRAIGVPTLFCSGTRDAFAAPEELRSLVAALRRAKLHLLKGADHGFSVPKASGRTREDIWTEAVDALLGWLAQELDT
jgi:hypothetical protein